MGEKCVCNREHRFSSLLPNIETKREVKPMATRKTAAKREAINTGTDKRFVRRDAMGQFKESDGVGRSLGKA